MNVPGQTSSEAFTYLKHIYTNKVGLADSDEEDCIQKKIAVLVAQHITAHPITASATPIRQDRPVCTNPLCPRKVRHTIEWCWAKGGGGEGKAPQSWKDKYGTSAAAVSLTYTTSAIGILTDPNPADLYVHHITGELGMSMSEASTVQTPDISINRQEPSILNVKCHRGESISIDNDVPITTFLVSDPSKCTVCHGNVSPLPLNPGTFLDSAASEHCWVSKSEFSQYDNIQGQRGSSAVAGTAGEFQIQGVGSVDVSSTVNGIIKSIHLTGVKHIPNFSNNLISVTTLDHLGYKGEWENRMLLFRALSGEIVMMGIQVGNLKIYCVDMGIYVNSA